MGQPTVDPVKFIQAINRSVSGAVVGYSFCIGGVGIPASRFGAGSARTKANGGEVPFTESTRTAMASVSKFLTAIAAVQLLFPPPGADPSNAVGADLDTPIYRGGLPKDWTIRDDAKQITYRDLLTHTSGLAGELDPNPPGEDYLGLKTYLTTTAIPLGPRGTHNYSNVGFSLFRLLLPKLAGIIQDVPPFPGDEQGRAGGYAAAYQRIVSQKVFGAVGVSGPNTATPVDHSHAFAYNWPGQSSGYDWSHWQYPGQVRPGDGQPLCAGAAYCWVSIDDIAPVLDSINKRDGRILSNFQWDEMQNLDNVNGSNLGLGLDTLTHPQNSQYRWVSKNGGLSSGDNTGTGQVSTDIAFFGPAEPVAGSTGPYYAALFINSDVWCREGYDKWTFCQKCFALTSRANGGSCPATKAAHVTAGVYRLSTAQNIPGQPGWMECSKCEALCYEPDSTHPSKCPADGQRHAPTGVNFTLPQADRLTVEFLAVAQPLWKWCDKCGCLAFSYGASAGGVCAAGGQHDFSDSGNYAVPMILAAANVLAEAYLESIS